MRIIIKQVDPRDAQVAQELSRLQKLCLPGDTPLTGETGTWWIAYYGKNAVAFASIANSCQWELTGYLNRAGVMRLFRGKGLQKRLIRVRVNYAISVGLTHLVSDTRNNPASSNSLISQKFKIYEPLKPWGWDDAIYWIRKL